MRAQLIYVFCVFRYGRVSSVARSQSLWPRPLHTRTMQYFCICTYVCAHANVACAGALAPGQLLLFCVFECVCVCSAGVQRADVKTLTSSVWPGAKNPSTGSTPATPRPAVPLAGTGWRWGAAFCVARECGRFDGKLSTIRSGPNNNIGAAGPINCARRGDANVPARNALATF